jgi:hypothetical protein
MRDLLSSHPPGEHGQTHRVAQDLDQHEAGIMTNTVLCTHCNTWVATSKYYEHLTQEHEEDED